MSEGDGGRKLGYLFGGALLAGALILGYQAITGGRAEDEDRPPIIVRGGSLIFQSGDPEDDDPVYKNGKPWVQVGSDWQPDHREAKALKWFSVQLTASDPTTCPILSMTKEVTIAFGDVTFVITSKGRPGSGTAAPTIVGSGLQKGGTSQNPQLIYNGSGSITSVRFRGQGVGNVVCTTASSLKIWQH